MNERSPLEVVLGIGLAVGGCCFLGYGVKLALGHDVDAGYAIALSLFTFGASFDPLNSLRFWALGRVDPIKSREMRYTKLARILFTAGFVLVAAMWLYGRLAR